jgi:hypothetical protein
MLFIECLDPTDGTTYVIAIRRSIEQLLTVEALYDKATDDWHWALKKARGELTKV